jgi:hypothetical protein
LGKATGRKHGSAPSGSLRQTGRTLAARSRDSRPRFPHPLRCPGRRRGKPLSCAVKRRNWRVCSRFVGSPLPDSNRRPPPYHRGSGTGSTGTAGSPWPRKQANQRDLTARGSPRVDARGPADVRATFARHVALQGNSPREPLRLGSSKLLSGGLSSQPRCSTARRPTCVAFGSGAVALRLLWRRRGLVDEVTSSGSTAEDSNRRSMSRRAAARRRRRGGRRRARLRRARSRVAGRRGRFR